MQPELNIYGIYRTGKTDFVDFSDLQQRYLEKSEIYGDPDGERAQNIAAFIRIQQGEELSEKIRSGELNITHFAGMIEPKTREEQRRNILLLHDLVNTGNLQGDAVAMLLLQGTLLRLEDTVPFLLRLGFAAEMRTIYSGGDKFLIVGNYPQAVKATLPGYQEKILGYPGMNLT